MSVTAQALIKDAYTFIGMNPLGATVDAAQAAQGLSCLNQILEQWSLMPLTIPVTAREVFPLTAGRGGPDDPYTIGPGGDFDTSRPTFITNVGLLFTDTTEPYEISRSVYTNDAYSSIVQKQLQSAYFSGLYYNATFASGWGSIYLWPVPSDDSTSLVLYRQMQLREYATVNTAYDLPPGARPALTWELASWLSDIAGQNWTGSMEQKKNNALAVYQRGNTVMSDLGMDPALTDTAGLYNILSDSTSGIRGR